MSASNSAAPVGAAAWIPVGEARSLASSGRLHACVQGRYISVLRIKGRLTCIDSICFHAGGPLTLGDIEDIEGKPCLICPWHDYKIDAFTGEKYFQAVSWQDGKMVPAGWKSNGPRHRVHEAEEREDGLLYVRLSTDPAELPSDEYAFNEACGSRILAAPSSTSARSSAAVGADGKRTGPRAPQALQAGSLLQRPGLGPPP